LVLLVLFVACLGKIGGAGFGARLSGMPAREALAVGFGLNARGAMEIILASVALESGLIDQRVFVALVVMAVVTSALAGPAMSRLTARANPEPEPPPSQGV
jgi:Kef-type K+ transport system membrane component KefB